MRRYGREAAILGFAILPVLAMINRYDLVADLIDSIGVTGWNDDANIGLLTPSLSAYTEE